MERVVLNALPDAPNVLRRSSAVGYSPGILFGQDDPHKEKRVIFNVLLRMTTLLSLEILPAHTALMTVG